MKKRYALAASIAVVLLLAMASLTLVLLVPATLTVEVTGKPGQRLVGSIETDGASRDLTATVPAKFTIKGNRLAYQVVPEDVASADRITVKTYVGNTHVTTCVGHGVEGGASGIWHQWTRGIPKSRPAEVPRVNPPQVDSLN